MSTSKGSDSMKQIRSSKHELERKQKELQRYLGNLDAEIKRRALQKASMVELRSLCQRRVRVQKGIEMLASNISKLESVEFAIKNASINQSILRARKAALEGMKTANQGMDVSDISRINNAYMREQEKSEMINEQLDQTFDMSLEEEEEVSDEMNKVLMEVAGVQIQGMNVVPVGGLTQEEQEIEALLKELGD